MDRESTIAWIREFADDARLLDEQLSGPAAARRAAVNPTCGDRADLGLYLSSAHGVRIRGQVEGCTLSMAAAVVAARTVAEVSPAEAAPLIDTAITRRLAGTGPAPAGDLGIFATMDLVPLRQRCVVFPWQLIAGLLAGV